MYDKVSDVLNEVLDKECIEYQLVLPHCHRTYLVKIVICTVKLHFIAILATVGPDVSLGERDVAIPQAEPTTNFMGKPQVFSVNVSLWIN